MAASKDLSIKQGRTFTLVLRWEALQKKKLSKAISAINGRLLFSSPVPGHGIPDRWRAAVTGVRDDRDQR